MFVCWSFFFSKFHLFFFFSQYFFVCLFLVNIFLFVCLEVEGGWGREMRMASTRLGGEGGGGGLINVWVPTSEWTTN